MEAARSSETLVSNHRARTHKTTNTIKSIVFPSMSTYLWFFMALFLNPFQLL